MDKTKQLSAKLKQKATISKARVSGIYVHTKKESLVVIGIWENVSQKGLISVVCSSIQNMYDTEKK